MCWMLYMTPSYSIHRSACTPPVYRWGNWVTKGLADPLNHLWNHEQLNSFSWCHLLFPLDLIYLESQGQGLTCALSDLLVALNMWLQPRRRKADAAQDLRRHYLSLLYGTSSARAITFITFDPYNELWGGEYYYHPRFIDEDPSDQSVKVTFQVPRTSEWQREADNLNPNCTICQLCDLGHFTYPLWAKVFPSVSGDNKASSYGCYRH